MTGNTRLTDYAETDGVYADTDAVSFAEAAETGKEIPIIGAEESGKENPWGILRERLAELDENPEQFDAAAIYDYSDLDGAGCAAMYRHEYGERVCLLPAAHSYGEEPFTAFEKAAEVLPEGMPLYIADLGQNADTAAEWNVGVFDLSETNPVRFRDHHGSTPEWFIENVQNRENCEYVHDDSVCATMTVLRQDVSDVTERIERIAALCDARDNFHDHLPEFDDSEPASNAAFWFGAEVTVDAMLTVGPDNLTEYDGFGDEFAARKAVREGKLDWVMDTARFASLAGYKVGYVFGDCYHSEAGRRLHNQHDCDVAVIVKPTGKVSLRSTDAAPVSADVCEELNGGGHEQAAGCNPAEGDETFNKAAHIAEHGLTLMREVTRVLVPALIDHKGDGDEGDREGTDANETGGAADGASA